MATITPVNGSANFPANPNTFLAAVETIAQQNVRAVISTNVIEDAFYEYDVKDGKVIEEAIIEMAKAQAFTPTANGAQPDLSPKDPVLKIRYFNNFEEKQYKVTKRPDEIRACIAKGMTAEELAAEILATLTAGEGDEDYKTERAIIEDATNVGVDASASLFGGKVPQNAKGIMFAIRRMFNAVKGCNSKGLGSDASFKQGVPVSDIRIAVSEDVLALIDMTELASLFNLSKEEILGKVVKLPYDENYAGNRVLVYDRKALGRATRTFDYSQDVMGTNRYSNHALTTSRAYFYNPLFKCLTLDVTKAVDAEEGKLIATASTK